MTFSPRYRALVYASLLASFLVVVWGGIVRVTGSGLGCPDWPLCHGQFLPSLDPATPACPGWPFCGAQVDLPSTGAPAIAMLHRYIAGIVGLLVVAACVEAWRHRRDAPGLGPLGIATAAIFLAQVAIGAANPLTRFSPWALGAHPAVASLLWCSVVGLAAVAWRPVSRQGALVRDLIALTKPAIMSLLLLTALGGMFLAERGVPPFGILAATLIGGAAASGGAASLNHYFDRDIDERMRRTRHRPLPAHRVSTGVAVWWGIALNIIAFVVLAVFANLLAATLALAGTVFYILVYTVWLKRSTAQNIVIGGAAGAVPPLVGWAAITGSLDLSAWLLFAIVFFWTPAHFWALALLIPEDYERAGVPMLPVVRGGEATAWNILAYAASLLPLTLLLFIIGGLGYVYLAVAVVLGGLFIAYAFRLLRSGAAGRRAMARAVYLYSLLYLALLFVAIMVDSTLRL